jgi:hypothetical protein
MKSICREGVAAFVEVAGRRECVMVQLNVYHLEVKSHAHDNEAPTLRPLLKIYYFEILVRVGKDEEKRNRRSGDGGLPYTVIGCF